MCKTRYRLGVKCNDQNVCNFIFKFIFLLYLIYIKNDINKYSLKIYDNGFCIFNTQLNRIQL